MAERQDGRPAAGVDAGGSGTRVMIATAGLRILARAEGPPGGLTDRSPRAAADTIRETLGRAVDAAGGLTPAVLVAGVAGAGDAERRAELERLLAGAAHRVRVVTDAEAALADAVPAGPGIVLIAGTGSIAWARGPNGESWRAGGRGPDAGDEGGGYWIAREAQTRGVLALPRDLSRRDAARHARSVLDAADRGDRIATDVVGAAADALSALVRNLRARFPRETPVPVALSGGLLGPDSPLARAVRERLSGLPLAILDRTVDPAMGACRVAVAGAW